MENEESRQRRIGFMTAIGMILERADDSTSETIMKVLNSFGKDLAHEINNDMYLSVAVDSGLDPCPEGFHWNDALQRCVED